MVADVVPIDCPRCRKVLYPITRLRPRPVDHPLARAGLVVAGLAAFAVYAAGFVLVRLVWGVFVPTVLLAPVLLVPAVVPGVLIVMALHRLPRSVRLRCAACGWGERYTIPRRRPLPATARFSRGPTLPEVGAPRTVPDPPPPADPADDFAVVDDAKADVRAWVYAEFVEGRAAGEIAADLYANGWDPAEADNLVEQGRRATRHRRP